MTDHPEAHLQATANLSPVSPSPVHTAAPLVVPALQDTAETIEAMVAAVTAADGAEAVAPVADGTNPAAPVGDNDAHIVDDDEGNDDDDDSFNDAYGEGADDEPQPQTQPQAVDQDDNDDYAKTFDSPVGSEDGGDMDADGDVADHVSSSVAPESNNIALQPDAPSTSLQNAANGAPAVASSGVNDALPSQQDIANANDPTAHPATQSAAAHDPNTPVPALENAAPANANTADTGAAPSVQQSESTATPLLPTNGEADGSPSDIRQLVADLTSQPSEPSTNNEPNAISTDLPAGSTSAAASSALPSPSSLPPRPPIPHDDSAAQSYSTQLPGSQAPTAAQPMPTPGHPAPYVTAGAPGTSTDAVGSLPPPPSTGQDPSAHAMNAATYASTGPSNSLSHDGDYQRMWDQFMADERQYMSEAKWDRFPEGSRLFIGNLSSDKVSKRDVFDLFHRYGRLAQISLKSAYGFVQYHSIDEGKRAIDNLQGYEIKGRRIHLEISRLQDKSKKDRNRSPDRGKGRDGRRGDKNHSRDDQRSGRNHSPRRHDHHRGSDGGYGRDRGFYDSGRGSRNRSRSPGYGRHDKDSYRRRSPSPYGHSRHGAELDLPRRYGADVPDIQVILQQEVNRDFVAWVEGAFKEKGLRPEVMFLHPRFPKDQVIQRQAAEGVHAVVELDMRAQNMGKIPVQVFDRSAGSNNVRFDQYVDLDPGTAAEVILRAKAAGAAAAYNQQYGAYQQPAYGVPSHAPPHAPHGHHAAHPPHQAAYAAPHAGGYAQQPAPSPADLAGLVGQVDNATLQRLLASMGGAQSAAPAMAPSAPAPAGGASAADIQALLSSLNTPGAQAPTQYGAPYGGQPAPGANGDSAAQVQNIMAQLSRYRQ